MKNNDFTSGPILPKLLKFMIPVLFSMLLQALYGAADLLIVGQFASTADVSAVSTGSQIISTLTNLIVSFSMGITVAVGQRIGQKRPEEASQTIGTGIILFAIIGVIFSIASVSGSSGLAWIMKAPEEAFGLTSDYIKICGAGFVVISAYNLLGSIFRGLGDSKTPLIAVGIACVFNIIGDLILVSVFKMGAAGAALATVFAQLISVIISFFMIRKATLPFDFNKAFIKMKKSFAILIAKIGIPVALQEFLVGISFLILLAIVNQLGVTASAGVGVAQKVCTFIMLVPISFMQSMTAFVAQNYGAGQLQRAQKTLKIGIGISFAFGIVMFLISFFRGDLLASVFSKDAETITASWDYLKAYAIDCLFTCFLFCFIGYFNGIGKTRFVMVQGLCGAFIIRVPFALLMQQFGNGSLFLIGMSIPFSTVLQIAMFFIAYFRLKKDNSFIERCS